MQLRYWDANCFLGWLKAEPDKVRLCEGVVQAAEAGKVKIVTSALTLTEVIWLKGHPKLPREREDAIRDFFQQEYIQLVNVDRGTAEQARELVWAHNVKPKDAIHVATAIRRKVEVLDTFDGALLELNGQLGTPALRIIEPDVESQGELQFPSQGI